MSDLSPHGDECRDTGAACNVNLFQKQVAVSIYILNTPKSFNRSKICIDNMICISIDFYSDFTLGCRCRCKEDVDKDVD